MGITIREAALSDAAAIARVHVDSWRTAYKGIVPDFYLANLSSEKRESGWKDAITNEESFIFVAVTEISKKIVGFVKGGRERSKNTEFTGEIGSIYIMEDYRGKGIGQKLVLALVNKLIDQGHNSMLVWVLAKNPYRRFYEKLGGKYLRSKEIEIGGSTYEEVAYGWKDLGVILAQAI